MVETKFGIGVGPVESNEGNLVNDEKNKREMRIQRYQEIFKDKTAEFCLEYLTKELSTYGANRDLATAERSIAIIEALSVSHPEINPEMVKDYVKEKVKELIVRDPHVAGQYFFGLRTGEAVGKGYSFEAKEILPTLRLGLQRAIEDGTQSGFIRILENIFQIPATEVMSPEEMDEKTRQVVERAEAQRKKREALADADAQKVKEIRTTLTPVDDV